MTDSCTIIRKNHAYNINADEKKNWRSINKIYGKSNDFKNICFDSKWLKFWKFEKDGFRFCEKGHSKDIKHSAVNKKFFRWWDK